MTSRKLRAEMCRRIEAEFGGFVRVAGVRNGGKHEMIVLERRADGAVYSLPLTTSMASTWTNLQNARAQVRRFALSKVS